MSDNTKFKVNCPLCKSALVITIQQLADEETITCPACYGAIHLQDINNSAKEILATINRRVFDPNFKIPNINVAFTSILQNKSVTSNSTSKEPEIVGTNCPYCAAELHPIPKRKKKRVSCGNYIYVKRRLNEKVKILVTENEANAIDQEWETKQRADEIEQIMREFNLSYYEIAKLQQQLGPSYSANDIRWSILNQRVIEAAKHGDWSQLGTLYFEMALICHNEKREFFHILQESQKCKLRSYLQSGFIKVEILAGKCSRCHPLQGKVYTIEEALQEMPIPVKDCEYWDGWCRCQYLALQQDGKIESKPRR